jgi:sensor histidine kinase regulating citrate/malate metabolism
MKPLRTIYRLPFSSVISRGAGRGGGDSYGLAIRVREIDSLFSKYQQTTSRKTCRDKGIGLGLVLCKLMGDARGGKIWAASELGVGSTFSLCLPPIGRSIQLPDAVQTVADRGDSSWAA